MTSDDKEAIDKLRERLSQPDGRDTALAMMAQMKVRPELIEALRISGAPAADLLLQVLDGLINPQPQPLLAGVYSHKDGFYLLLGPARDHATGEERVAYIPLAVNPKWNGTARIALRTPEDFRANFTWVSERQPNIQPSQVPRAEPQPRCADPFGCDPSYSCFSDPTRCSKRPKP